MKTINNLGMENLYPSFYASNPSWLIKSSTEWTKEENKRFESALAVIGEQDPERWIKVASLIPGKTVSDVIKQYRELLEDVSDIEAGKVPIPGYFTSSFTLELVEERDFDGYRKRPLTAKSSDQERKKGIPWTEDEHRRFLMGLIKHGKGDWRNISRNFVVTKTPTQVASHAQKYFIRQQISLSGVKDKRRPSIHDITTRNIADGANPLDAAKFLSSLDQPSALFSPQKPSSPCKVLSNLNHIKDGSSVMVFDSTKGNLFMSEAASSGLKLYGQNLNTGFQGDRINPCGMYFQMPRYQVR